MSTVAPELNATAASLLGFLLSGPCTGWDLVQAVEGSIGNFWNVTRSQVYRELRTLEREGLVEAGETGPRDRRPYAVTEAGRQAFRSWIAREPGDAVIRFPLLLSVFFGQHVDPPVLRRYLALHRAQHEQRLAEYEELHQAIGDLEEERFPVYALRFGIEYERAVLRWLDALPPLTGAPATAPAAPAPGDR